MSDEEIRRLADAMITELDRQAFLVELAERRKAERRRHRQRKKEDLEAAA